MSFQHQDVLAPQLLDELKQVARNTVEGHQLAKNDKVFYLLINEEPNKTAVPITILFLNEENQPSRLFDFQMVQFGLQLVRLNILALIVTTLLNISDKETGLVKIATFALIYVFAACSIASSAGKSCRLKINSAPAAVR